ncbi:MAG: YitT family protein, partial [Alistipes sp.]|nr:YitT family protein [Alistipes sp.]
AMEELDIGMTLLAGEGAYSHNKKDVILCVVRKQIAPGLEDIVKEEDPAAFLIITSASEIYGEGYKNILGTRL